MEKLRAFYPMALMTSLMLLAFIVGLASCDVGKKDPEYFGIYTSTLAGGQMKLIISDPQQEMTHARVSPDHKKIVFTRYNKRNFKGLALETGGYQQTEIMLVNIDGTGLETLVPARKGQVAANASWSPDGKSIIFVSNDNPERKGQISRIDLATRKISKVPVPANLWAGDPHLVGDRMVFTNYQKNDRHNVLWTMMADGSKARQLTRPSISAPRKMHPPPGDFDPRLSPDGSKTTLQRHVNKTNWHIVVVDIETGKEKDISSRYISDKAIAADGMAEWSSDGKLLIIWHANVDELLKSGLYTMKPDGSDRKRISLPRGQFYKMASFFPGETADSNAQIIFSTKKEPRL